MLPRVGTTIHPILTMDSLQGMSWDSQNSISELLTEEDAGTQVRGAKKTAGSTPALGNWEAQKSCL